MKDGAVIRFERVTKCFAETEALSDLTFDVPAGSVFGLVGPNGSGKTTAIRLLLGLLRPDQGRTEIFGQPSLSLDRTTRQRIGYLSEEGFPYADLPIDDLLRFVSAFFESWDWDRSRDLLTRMDVPRDQPLCTMSAGERRRAELLIALAQDPDLLVLDDPTAGLDAAVRRRFLLEALALARHEGKTVLFTSHVLSDVERIVDTVGFLVNGHMRSVTLLDELKATTKRLVFEGTRPREPLEGELTRDEAEGRTAVVTASFSKDLLATLRARHPRVHVEDLGLEDIFLAVTAAPGRAAR